MNVVSKKPSHTLLQPSRVAGKAAASKIHFRYVMARKDGDRTQRPGVGIGCAFVIHRDIKETSSAQRFARRLDFFQVAAEGFFTLVETEHCLKWRWDIGFVRHMIDKGVVYAMANCPFEGLMQNPAPAHAVEFPQLGFKIRYVGSGPPPDNRRIETAKLGYMKERPRALNDSRLWRSRQPALQGGSQT
jgi:hypothetical protein